jgi:hypothetical protein
LAIDTAGIVSRNVGVRPFRYLTAMVVTIGVWLVLTPAINAVAPRRTKDWRSGAGRISTCLIWLGIIEQAEPPVLRDC